MGTGMDMLNGIIAEQNTFNLGGQDALKQIIEWGNSDCPHVSHQRGKHWCSECWDNLEERVRSLNLIRG